MSKADEIPALSFILEPLLVASLLTAGCLINYRSGASQALVHASKLLRDHRPEKMPFFGKMIRIPDTERFRRNVVSRFLAYFPFLMEVWYWLLTYWVYQIARACQALTMGSSTRATSQEHGIWLLNLEKKLGLDMELWLQGVIIKEGRGGLLWFFNKTYAMVHIPATISFIGYAFWAFPPPTFQKVRRTLVFCNWLAFILFTAWPCMPPRLLPFEEYHYVDTLHTGKAASIWTTNKFQNQLAAFPSLHFGYSWVIGFSLFMYAPHKGIRYIALGYPVLIALVIMATANHYFLDAVGGFFVTVTAYKLNTYLLYLRPLEEWGFWLCRTEKPLDKAIFDQALREHGIVTAGVSDSEDDVNVHLLNEDDGPSRRSRDNNA